MRRWFMGKMTWPVATVILGAIAAIVTMYWLVPKEDAQTRGVIITGVIGLVGAIQVYFTRKGNRGDDNQGNDES